MDISLISRSHPAPPRTMIMRCTPTASLTLAPRRRWATVSAWLLQTLLDPRLADGTPPESTRLLAARAGQLVHPRNRHAVADAWDGVLTRATRPRGTIDPRVPVARHAVHTAAAEITALTAALRSVSPVAARDVARAAALLTGGVSPVYTGTPDLRPIVAALTNDLAGGRRAD